MFIHRIGGLLNDKRFEKKRKEWPETTRILIYRYWERGERRGRSQGESLTRPWARPGKPSSYEPSRSERIFESVGSDKTLSLKAQILKITNRAFSEGVKVGRSRADLHHISQLGRPLLLAVAGPARPGSSGWPTHSSRSSPVGRVGRCTSCSVAPCGPWRNTPWLRQHLGTLRRY
jgi:hypothetical protein